MKISFVVCSLLLLFSSCNLEAQKQRPKSVNPASQKPAAQKPPARTATPQDRLQADIKAFVYALNDKNAFPDIMKYVSGARFGFYGASEWHDWWRRDRIADDLAVANVRIHKFAPTEAEVSFSYRTFPQDVETHNAGPFALKLDHTAIDFEKTEPKVWQFVPRPPTKDESLKTHPMLWAVWMLSQAPESLAAFRAGVAADNLQTLGVAARKFEQDFNDRYAFSAEFQKVALQHYLRFHDFWTIPGTNETFLFNNRLSGKQVDQIAEPARTILFYDGRDEKPQFRYDGKTLVCLADGRVEFADADRFKTFLWQ